MNKRNLQYLAAKKLQPASSDVRVDGFSAPNGVLVFGVGPRRLTQWRLQ